MSKYQDIYPSEPIIDSANLERKSISHLLNFEYFEAQPDSMPVKKFTQHHILINLNEKEHRVENWRSGEHRDFTFRVNEVVITPAGVESGWRWHAKSKVIVVTIEPEILEQFALHEIGIVLTTDQLIDVPQFTDEDIVNAARLALHALENKSVGYDLMFESLSRVFLIKLIQKYGSLAVEGSKFSKGFSSTQYKKVLDFIKANYSQTIGLEELAKVAGISRFHFSRLFKSTIGKSPMQFVLEFRVQQGKKLLQDLSLSLSDVAARCGFSDQAHFSRAFKSIYGISPKSYR